MKSKEEGKIQESLWWSHPPSDISQQKQFSIDDFKHLQQIPGLVQMADKKIVVLWWVGAVIIDDKLYILLILWRRCQLQGEQGQTERW